MIQIIKNIDQICITELLQPKNLLQDYCPWRKRENNCSTSSPTASFTSQAIDMAKLTQLQIPFDFVFGLSNKVICKSIRTN
jgi:hypothetical protein